MYKAFFGFSERPFKLVPDPAYFFLGPSHEEALAHLEFAVKQGEGFTLITGEVGTGKTTLCRRFLENLDEDTEVAYIFNPVLEVVELLKSINEEYGISSDADRPRELINQLNTFLLDMKARNHQVILIIDEAQNLSADVLEQLRLLSNLETTRSKLLQIILVGQPELNDLLSSYHLRQLGQRISLSCRLLPLTRAETGRYIAHRVSIASNRPEAVFSPAAIREIHTYSGGIPRLINTACDRSLLAAFSKNEHHVSGKTARLAVKELRNNQNRRSFHGRVKYPWAWIPVAVGFLALAILYGVPKMMAVNSNFSAETRPPASSSNPARIPVAGIRSASPMSEAAAAGGLKNWMQAMDPIKTRRNAMLTVLRRWEILPEIGTEPDAARSDFTYFRKLAGNHGMGVYRTADNLTRVLKMDLPAILAFDLDGITRYLVLIKWEDRSFILTDGERRLSVSAAELLNSGWKWTYILWKDFAGIAGTIPSNTTAETILTFKMLLRKIGFPEVPLTSDYGDVARGVVEKIQADSGLFVDGLVGPATKIVIYRELTQYRMPRIRIVGSQKAN